MREDASTSLGPEPSQPPASGLCDLMHEHRRLRRRLRGRHQGPQVAHDRPAGDPGAEESSRTAARAAARSTPATAPASCIQMPDAFLRKVAPAPLPPAGDYGCGLVFLPQEAAHRAAVEQLIAQIVAEEGQTLIGWRDVPSDDSPVGPSAVAVEPVFRQVFIGKGTVPARARRARTIRRPGGVRDASCTSSASASSMRPTRSRPPMPCASCSTSSACRRTR